jgi:hypothetical protein
VFLDADDLQLPQCLPARLEAARATGGEHLIFGLHFERWGHRDDAPPVRPMGEPRATYLRGNVLPTHTALIPRALLARVEGPFTEGLFSFEDWDLWLRLAFAGAPFTVLSKRDCVYRMRLSMMNSRPQAAAYALQVLDRIEPAVCSAPDAAALLPLWRRTRMEMLLWQTSFELRAGHPMKVARGLLSAVRASPRDVVQLPGYVARRVWTRALRRRRLRDVDGPGPAVSYDPS